MIELDLRRTRGSFDLDVNVTLDAPAIGLFGPSGAGKSTLLGMIAGFIKPDHGRLVVDGRCFFDSEQGIDIPVYQRRIGMVFQESRLFPHLNVRDNLNYGSSLLLPKHRQFELRHIVELLDIERLLLQRPRQLSGGEKQRVALGRAILSSPRLLLLDEPLASLDSGLKNQILPFLKRVKDEIQIPMLYVSHAIGEVLYLTSQLAMMQQGRLLGLGQFHEVINDARVLALAHSLGLENVLNLSIQSHSQQDGYTSTVLGSQCLYIPLIDTNLGSEVTVSIACSNIALSRNKLSGVTIQNQLAGVVTEIRHVGTRVLVTIDAGHLLIAEITAKGLADLQIARGVSVYCLIKTQSIHVLLG